MALIDLPDEILLLILAALGDPRDVRRLGAACHQLRALAVHYQGTRDYALALTMRGFGCCIAGVPSLDSAGLVRLLYAKAASGKWPDPLHALEWCARTGLEVEALGFSASDLVKTLFYNNCLERLDDFAVDSGQFWCCAFTRSALNATGAENKAVLKSILEQLHQYWVTNRAWLISNGHFCTYIAICVAVAIELQKKPDYPYPQRRVNVFYAALSREVFCQPGGLLATSDFPHFPSGELRWLRLVHEARQ